MKIVCVGYLHGAGGAERQIVMLANALAEKNHEVHLIILVENKSTYMISNKVITHDLTKIENLHGNKILIRYRKLKSEMIKIKPDLSIHYWLQSAYLCAFMTKKISGKIIYSERGNPGDSEYRGLLYVIRKLAFRRVDGFVFQSEGAQNFFSESIKKRSIIISNSVNITPGKFLIPCNKREKKIVSVGRLHPQKNQKILIEAFSIISDEFPQYTLEIYGDGPLKTDLNDQIVKLGMKRKIYLKGTTNDILDRVYAASLFVLASNYEGMPNALMEAMAIGVPCISTDCKPGGARSLISQGVNGWIVPRNNSALLAEQMRKVLLNMDKSEIIAKEATKIRIKYSHERVFDRWEQFCRKVIE